MHVEAGAVKSARLAGAARGTVSSRGNSSGPKPGCVGSARTVASMGAAVVFVLALAAGCSRVEEPDGSDGNSQRTDGAYRLNIEESGSLQNPAWSPDGKSIVFTRFRNGYNKGPADLIVVDLETGSTRTLVSDGGENVNLPGSSWNSTTGRVVFSSSRDPHDEVFIIDGDGSPGEEVRITSREDSVAYEPSVSPGGDWIAFESHKLDVEGEGIIAKCEVDGGGVYEWLTTTGDSREPNWSPAGDLIVYQALTSGRWNIWTMSTDGTGKKMVTGGPGDKTDASFSPDGEWIVYSFEEPGGEYANLFALPVSGGTPVRVTAFDGYDGAPSWSPDGRLIAFESCPGDPEDCGGTSIWMIAAPDR